MTVIGKRVFKEAVEVTSSFEDHLIRSLHENTVWWGRQDLESHMERGFAFVARRSCVKITLSSRSLLF